tara:strand:- start:65 stop:616 length:552 start_codon:yes stop_codon:yes gene_type:complete
MVKIQVLETTAVVWIHQVKLNNKVNFQITNVAHLYWCHLIIIFQMLHQQISPMLKRNHLLGLNLNLINSHQELKNTGREILMEVLLVANLVLVRPFLGLVLLTQTCKFSLKRVKMENSMSAPTCNKQINNSLTQVEARRKKHPVKYLRKGVKRHLKTHLCFKTETIRYNYNIIELILTFDLFE